MTVYLTRWSEDHVLAYFWQMVRAGADRVALLEQLNTVAIRRPKGWSKVDARKVHHAYPTSCFCCLNGDRKLYWHHIISVDHGGGNAVRNLVALCLRCHARIHPWMPSDRPGEVLTGFHDVRDLVQQFRRRMKDTA